MDQCTAFDALCLYHSAAMPVQNSVPILARSYGADQKFAASSLGYSVLLYLAYIPLLLKLIL